MFQASLGYRARAWATSQFQLSHRILRFQTYLAGVHLGCRRLGDALTVCKEDVPTEATLVWPM